MTAISPSRLLWYGRRAAKMSPAEVVWRARDQVVRTAWSRRQVGRDQPAADAPLLSQQPRFPVVLPPDTAAKVPEPAADALLAAADELLKGEWEVLGATRTDMAQPDWFFDPITGVRAPADRYAFRINHRSQAVTGNVKQIWEISRLQHLTLLAAAWFVSRDDVYARRVAEQLRSWWRENPFLSGVNWTSGIEVGLRLISMAWIRRLMNDWPETPALFEHDQLALRQIRWHQQYLDGFCSRGSSANNHVIAEAAGQLVASCAFPWFSESTRWRARSAKVLAKELEKNTFPSGINRELASGYQSLVAELVLLAAVECDAAGYPLSEATWQRLSAMVDSGAALLDEALRPPRQGDGDDGMALLLDAPGANRWPSLLAVSERMFGRLSWWPSVEPDAASAIIGALAGRPREIGGRPAARPWRFADAGTTLLRTSGERDSEIWCRCDGGPHGYLSIAAHAHADALSVEVRYGGVDVLSDPGTYCYHGEPAWRSYFRSTIAHNTVEVDGRSQSVEGGPFLWLRQANAREVEVMDIGDAVEWTAEHDGYRSRGASARHRRCVRLDRATRSIDIVDEVRGGSFDVRLAFHLGPDVLVDLEQKCAMLRWPGALTPGTARLELPHQLRWSVHRGQTDPILGWYSAGLGRRVPAATLVGYGRSHERMPLTTRLEFFDVRRSGTHQHPDSSISWVPAGAIAEQPRPSEYLPNDRPETR